MNFIYPSQILVLLSVDSDDGRTKIINSMNQVAGEKIWLVSSSVKQGA